MSGVHRNFTIMINRLLTPVRLGSYLEEAEFSAHKIGRKHAINLYEVPDTTGVQIALIGVNESRASHNNSGSANGADIIRKHFYNLSVADLKINMIDAGDVIIGETVEETYQNLKMVMEYFLAQRIIPVIIGGSQDITVGQYNGYEVLGQAVNLAVIDEQIDMFEKGKYPGACNWILDILAHEKNYLFNYSAIGAQGHFLAQEMLNTIDTMYFDICRLGKIKESFRYAEPEIRDADIVSFDIAAIKACDAPGHAHATPNGLTSEEACQIMRYAGMSDKVSSVGIYEYNPMFDNQEITAQLIAQMIWYFMDGYHSRKQDYPITDERNFTKYIVNLQGNSYDLTFWKSNKSGRWWVEVPFTVRKKFERHQLVPCSYEDYVDATNNILPDKWMKVFAKLGS
ncbi:MAG: formimidoylglutamase [Chitinophagales bacterium]|nr:formimidoylglutamase [Chitinophagales bacterium]